MNLVLHQFRKDIRQFRVYLAVWSGLLLLDLAASLGWVGKVGYDPVRGFDQASISWTGLQTAFLYLMGVGLPSFVVLADSPSRRDGFLGTRPMSRRDLIAAKSFFLIALVLFPWVVQEFLRLVLEGLPWEYVLHGTLEQLVYTTSIVVSAAAFAALWPSYGKWAAGLAIAFGGAYALALVWALLAEFVFHFQSNLDGLNTTRDLAGRYFVAVTLLVLAAGQFRRSWRPVWHWSGLAAVVMGCLLISMYWPWDIFAPQPSDPTTATALIHQSGFQVPLRNVKIFADTSTRSDRGFSFGLNIRPRIEPPPTGHVVQWVGEGTKLVPASGRKPLPGSLLRQSPVLGWPGMNPDAEDVEACVDNLPEDIFIRTGPGSFFNNQGDTYLGKFSLSQSDGLLREPVAIQASLQARVFRWDKIADLPLKPGSAGRDPFGVWTLVATRSDRAQQTEIFLRCDRINFATTADPRLGKASYWPGGRMIFLLYDPQFNVVFLPDVSPYASKTRATHTAYSRFFLTLPFNQLASRVGGLAKSELARCRLLIFQKTWLGSVPKEWQSPALTLNDRLTPPNVNFGPDNAAMPHSELERRMAGLKTPDSGASRTEVTHHLLELLRVLDAYQRPLDPGDAAIIQLISLVQSHLDILLDGLPVMSSSSKRAVITAIERGATESQKAEIIAALPQEPELATVLLAHGWVEDAQVQLQQLLDAPRSLPLDALRAVAWSEDPQTYPRLLAELEFDPEGQLYDLLCTLPGIKPQLDLTVERLWHKRSRIVRWMDLPEPLLGIGLRQGKPEALRTAYQLLTESDADRSGMANRIANILRDSVTGTGLKPEELRNPRRMTAWLIQHRAEDFVFDPARRRFVLKKSQAERETAGVSQQTP